MATQRAILMVGLGLLLLTLPAMAEERNAAPATSVKSQAAEPTAVESPRRGQQEVSGWSHAVLSPRDAATGMATGKRQHEPVHVKKRIEKSKPALTLPLAD